MATVRNPVTDARPVMGSVVVMRRVSVVSGRIGRLVSRRKDVSGPVTGVRPVVLGARPGMGSVVVMRRVSAGSGRIVRRVSVGSGRVIGARRVAVSGGRTVTARSVRRANRASSTSASQPISMNRFLMITMSGTCRPACGRS